MSAEWLCVEKDGKRCAQQCGQCEVVQQSDDEILNKMIIERVKRYELVSDESGNYMVEAIDGEYVRYQDIAHLMTQAKE